MLRLCISPPGITIEKRRRRYHEHLGYCRASFFHAVGYMFGRPPGVADYEPTLQEPYSAAGR